VPAGSPVLPVLKERLPENRPPKGVDASPRHSLTTRIPIIIHRTGPMRSSRFRALVFGWEKNCKKSFKREIDARIVKDRLWPEYQNAASVPQMLDSDPQLSSAANL
jgi:hypothetical protein